MCQKQVRIIKDLGTTKVPLSDQNNPTSENCQEFPTAEPDTAAILIKRMDRLGELHSEVMRLESIIAARVAWMLAELRREGGAE